MRGRLQLVAAQSVCLVLLARLTWTHQRLLRVRHVPLANTPPLRRRHALCVQVALLISTPIHPQHVPRAVWGRLQLVAAQSVCLVLLARLTLTHQRLPNAKFVLPAHTPLRVPSRVTFALPEQRTATATPRRLAKSAPLDIMQHRRPRRVRRAQQVKQTLTRTQPRHVTRARPGSSPQ